MSNPHECRRCGACCRWRGEVKVSEAEITAISRHLGLSEDVFIQTHTRVRFLRNGLALEERPNGECILLNRDACRVHSVKPQQCRDFPNRWNFPGWKECCQAQPRRSVTPGGVDGEA